MRVAIINLRTSKRDDAVARALEQGFRAHDSELWMYSETGPKKDDTLDHFDDIVEWAQLVCLIGHIGNQPIWSKFNRAGKDILLVDEAYLFRNRYWRLALNGWQSPWMTNTHYEPDRLYKIMADAGIVLHAYNEAPHRAVTYAGVDFPFAQWHKLGNALEYDSNALRRTANDLTDQVRHLITRVPYPNTRGLWVGNKVEVVSNKVPLEDSLFKSLSLVSYAQPACVTAMICGVPVVDLSPPGVNPIWPFVETNLSQASNPSRPLSNQRIIALSRLACNQFTLAEIASGFALQEIMPHTAKPFETFEGTDEECVIAQYRHMHANPKMFRGGLATSFVKRIKVLVDHYKPTTLLDYGSGKGRQYDETEQHRHWGGLKPRCYDPGHGPYSTKPEGYFDGVICTDVAEHIPPSGIDQFLLEVIGCARRFVFFCIFTDKAVKYLPDGRNVHLTIQPPSWWNHQIMTTMAKINPQTYPSIIQESDDTFVMRNNGMEIVVFYRSKDTEKESSK